MYLSQKPFLIIMTCISATRNAAIPIRMFYFKLQDKQLIERPLILTTTARLRKQNLKIQNQLELTGKNGLKLEKDSPSVDYNICVPGSSGMRKSPLWFLAHYIKLSPRKICHIKNPNIIVVLLVSNSTNHIYL